MGDDGRRQHRLGGDIERSGWLIEQPEPRVDLRHDQNYYYYTNYYGYYQPRDKEPRGSRWKKLDVGPVGPIAIQLPENCAAPPALLQPNKRP